MTTEEAIKRIHRFVETYKICGKDNYNPTTNITKLDYEAFKTAIESLEQQPCEDCVNREAVAEMLNEMPMKITETWMDFYRKALNSLNKLPCVTPSRPNGKWKRISPAGIYECTNCNQVIMTSDIDCYKYCHGCGVRMEGEE